MFRFFMVMPIAALLCVQCSSDPQEEVCDNGANGDNVDQDNYSCTTSPTVSNEYSESVNGDIRTITTNGIPTHDYRNQIPMKVAELNSSTKVFNVDFTPSLAISPTSILDNTNHPAYDFGVATSGVPIDPAPGEPFIFKNASGTSNWDWVMEPTNNMSDVGLDCAVAHVQPDGVYHYHGDMGVYADQLSPGISSGAVPAGPVQVGWAADGYPILYKYGPDKTGTFKLLLSSFQLKSGERPGDGNSAPCGPYNGKYTNDYEYVEGSGDLDACNGLAHTVTIGAEMFNYFYVVTDAFPVIPRCISGTPDVSFKKGI